MRAKIFLCSLPLAFQACLSVENGNSKTDSAAKTAISEGIYGNSYSYKASDNWEETVETQIYFKPEKAVDFRISYSHADQFGDNRSLYRYSRRTGTYKISNDSLFFTFDGMFEECCSTISHINVDSITMAAPADADKHAAFKFRSQGDYYFEFLQDDNGKLEWLRYEKI